MLEARYERPAGRGGPGAGRPAKLYARSGVTAAVSVPARAYDVAAELLARAVEAEPTGAARESLMAVARQVGESLRDELPAKAGDAADRLEVIRRLLGARGYEPFDEGDELRLRNCPFHRLVRRGWSASKAVSTDIPRSSDWTWSRPDSALDTDVPHLEDGCAIIAESFAMRNMR